MRNDFRVIVAGNRDFNNYDYVSRALDYLFSNNYPDMILHGACRGVDELADRYALLRGIPVDRYPADWAAYGNAAGPRRNAEMACNADALVAFWDGCSRGTGSMIDIAKRKNLIVKVIQIA